MHWGGGGGRLGVFLFRPFQEGDSAMADLPTAEDLEQLPLRSIVAYAARCARRYGLVMLR